MEESLFQTHRSQMARWRQIGKPIGPPDGTPIGQARLKNGHRAWVNCGLRHFASNSPFGLVITSSSFSSRDFPTMKHLFLRLRFVPNFFRDETTFSTISKIFPLFPAINPLFPSLIKGLITRLQFVPTFSRDETASSQHNHGSNHVSAICSHFFRRLTHFLPRRSRALIMKS